MKRTPLKRKTPMARGTKKLAAQSPAKHKVQRRKEYAAVVAKLRKQYPYCQVEGCQNPADDPHHRRGRAGSFLSDPQFIMMVCRPCHEKIERERAWAMSMQYLLPR